MFDIKTKTGRATGEARCNYPLHLHFLTVKQCAKEVVGNGTAYPDKAQHDYDTSVTYSCHPSYNHTGGNLVRTCDASANWTGTLPTCTGRQTHTHIYCINTVK